MVSAATMARRSGGPAAPGSVISPPARAPAAGAIASSPPNRPFWASGTQSPAQADSGPIIMFSANCQPAITATSAGRLAANWVSISNTEDRASPAATQARRPSQTSLAQPNRILPALAAIAPVAVVAASHDKAVFCPAAAASICTGSRMVRNGMYATAVPAQARA